MSVAQNVNAAADAGRVVESASVAEAQAFATAGLGSAAATVANDLRAPANDVVATKSRLLQRRHARNARRATRAL